MKAVCLSLARAWVQAPVVTGSNTLSAANSFRNSCRWRWIDLTVFCKTKSMTTGEAQLPLPCEVLRTYAMTPAELQIAELPPQFLDKINDMDGNAFNDGAHSHFE